MKMSKKLKKDLGVGAAIVAIITMVGLGTASYEDYSNVVPEEVCNDIDQDGYVVTKAELRANWADLLNPKCSWVIGYGDCRNFDADIHPGAEDPEGDGIDQNCDGADGDATVYYFGKPFKFGQ